MRASLPAWIAAGRGARVLLAGEPVAVFGELSAAELPARKLRQPCVIGDGRCAAVVRGGAAAAGVA